MEVIYIDEVVILNLLCDYFILLASARISGIVPRRGRYAVAATVGALYAAAVYLPGFGFLVSGVWKLLTAILMSVIAFLPESRPLRCGVIFFLCAALFGGMLYAISLTGRAPVFSFRALVFSFGVSYFLISVFLRARGKHGGCDVAEVQVELSGQIARFNALVDTGNGLTDPIGGGRVLIASPGAVKELFGGDIALFALGAVECVEAASHSPALRGKLRLVPYSAIGKAGLLPAFTPDSLTVAGRPVKNVAVAVSADAAGAGFEGIW